MSPGTGIFREKLAGMNAVVVCSKSQVPLRFITTLGVDAKE
jgi:hypothetical protein